MAKRKLHGHPVLILGAGRGGSALLEMFLEDELVDVLAIADSNPAAPGVRLAQERGIPVYFDPREAVLASRDYPDCIVYNLTHDDSIDGIVGEVFGQNKVTSGAEAKLFWQMVTRLKRIKDELEKSQNQLEAIIHHAMDAIITIDESAKMLAFNPAAEKIFGYCNKEVLGEKVNMLMPEPFYGEHDSYLESYRETGKGGIVGMAGREVVGLKKDGSCFPAELSVSEMVLSGKRYFVGIVRDLTERKAAEEKIKHLAHHDHLTDLPNRVLFMDRLDQAISLAKRSSAKIALLFLDLDGFKLVNDRMGHDMGDRLLQGVALRLNEIVRSSDTVARVGGDEFVLVLNNIGSTKDAAIVAEKIIQSLALPFELNGKECRVGGSVGIAVFPDDSELPETLLKRADEAMYVAKQNGKNNYRFHAEKLNERL